MKSLIPLCIFLVLLPSCTRQKQEELPAPQSLDGVMDLQWGDSPATVRKKLLKIPGVVFVSDTLDFTFTGGSYLGHNVDEWVLSFWKGRYLWHARIVPRQDPQTVDALVNELEQDLEDRYGASSGARTWRFGVEGEERTNNVSIIYSPETPVEIWYNAHGFVDSLEHARRPTGE